MTDKVEIQQKIKPPRRSWNMEICSIVLSLAAIVAIIVLLVYADGKPLSNWTAPLSLNTVMSILGVISHISLAFAVSSCVGQEKWNWFKKRPERVLAFRRFDDASRGPWGSAQLIWWLKLRLVEFIAPDPIIYAKLPIDTWQPLVQLPLSC